MANDNSMFDKIVEFGMGMTVARQIPQMMDVAMSQVNQQPMANTPPEIKTDIIGALLPLLLAVTTHIWSADPGTKARGTPIGEGLHM